MLNCMHAYRTTSSLSQTLFIFSKRLNLTQPFPQLPSWRTVESMPKRKLSQVIRNTKSNSDALEVAAVGGAKATQTLSKARFANNFPRNSMPGYDELKSNTLNNTTDDSDSPLSEPLDINLEDTPVLGRKAGKKTKIKPERLKAGTDLNKLAKVPKTAIFSANLPSEDGESDVDDEELDEEKIKEALLRPAPVNSSYLPLPWKGRLGYVSFYKICRSD